ncbi:protoporphyrinogen/coproporphyrinogen oxidase [Pedobacter xixiisoli]|uniref:Protoporphyrinogen oxidase n=1 Tax=Pedobacter xixiisoli TaxID=1476464 RepID=A0A286A9S5_9SPHI|nr:NAD(P)-binding protein [Pedobacter xixiisoli]SOD18632.1 Protoporphyrinogen oxidase [Pedobacter xixiisoli]
MKVAIIGSGISGLSIANMLNQKHQVTVFEKNQKIGGLVKCERINGSLFHKVGGHVFNSKNQKVLNWFWSFFDIENEFVQAKRKAKILFNGKIIGYPIENYLYLLDPEIVKKIINELLTLQKEEKKAPLDYSDFGTFLQKNFGKTLYQQYFEPYNKKIWNIDLHSVSMEWLEGKLPMPNLEEVIQSNIFREEENNMVHSYFYYPKNNGSQFIVDRLKENLSITTRTEISEVDINNGNLKIDNQLFDKLIYCGDVRKLPANIKKILEENNVDVKYLEQLRSNGTSNLFCETDETDISWLYIPENFTKAHRIIYTGNFSKTNNSGSIRKTCVVEFSGKVSEDEMEKEITLLPGNLKAILSNYEPNSYVIQDDKTRAEIKKAKDVLGRYGVYLLGRFAEWEYYNMDKAIEAAFELANTINLDNDTKN